MRKRWSAPAGVLMIFVAAGLASPAAAQTEQQAIDWCDNEAGTFSPDQRISGCSALIKANAKDYAAFVSRGLAYYEKDDYDHAIVDYTEATKIDPNRRPPSTIAASPTTRKTTTTTPSPTTLRRSRSIRKIRISTMTAPTPMTQRRIMRTPLPITPNL